MKRLRRQRRITVLPQKSGCGHFVDPSRCPVVAILDPDQRFGRHVRISAVLKAVGETLAGIPKDSTEVDQSAHRALNSNARDSERAERMTDKDEVLIDARESVSDNVGVLK